MDITGSPVSVDSLICNDCASSNTPSAGTSSPVLSITTSPTTISFLDTSCIFPSRNTVTIISSFTALRTSKAFAALTSNINPIVLAKIIAIKIPNGSRKALKPSCSGPQQCTQEIPSDKTQAKSNIRIIGSSNFSRNCFHNGIFSGGVRIFSPCRRRFSKTCSDVNP